VGAHLLRLLLVVLAALACCGCTRDDEVIHLREWALVTPSGARRPVTLPCVFSARDVSADGRVVLETVVEVPAGWRGGPVALAVPMFFGGATLSVNGTWLRDRPLGGSHSWQLAQAFSEAPTAALRLELDEWLYSPLPIAPRVSPTANGDSETVAAATFNEDSSIVGTAVVALVAGIYVALFLFDRRRVAHGWFALAAALAVPGDSLLIWAAHVSPWMEVVLSLFHTGGMLAGVGFYRAYFRWARMPRAFLVLLALEACAALLFVAPPVRQAALGVQALCWMANFAWMLALLLREWRRGGDPFAVRAFTACWLLMIAAEVVNFVVFLPHERSVWGSCVAFPTAVAGYGILQAIVLGRDYVRSLRDTEARVTELEAQRREVGALNEELRRQVAERSRELTEALAKSEGSVVPAALDVGDLFDGRYRVTRGLGRGGMGAVYEVERTRDGRKLALKVVTGAMSAKHAARFAREAEIGARLQHENLVSIVDVGIAAGATPFLVMELVQGGSLEDKRTRFGDAAWARPIVRQIAAGLAELHANRIVHRDLKPGNVLLVENGGSSPPVAKISDFGISRFGALDDSSDVDAEGATAHSGAAHASPRDLTETGAIMGTPVYMPPEAWFGPAKHPSADVFSLGMLAYEALTGRSPFAVPPVLLVRSRQPIPTPAALDGVDAKVASLVLACLRVEPTDRPRAKEIADALG
jgi:hypothetical protein